MVTAEQERLPLSRERVLRTAVAIADEHGIEAVTMRRVGDELGAEAMSLYHHVANKNDLLDGVVDLVAEEINDVVDGLDDATGRGSRVVRARILAARQVLLRHPWAPGLLATRSTLSPNVVTYHDRLVGPAARRRVHVRPRPPRAARPGQPRARVLPGAVRPGRRGVRRAAARGDGGRGAVARRDADRGRARRPGLDPGLVRRPDGVRVRARPPARRAGASADRLLTSLTL